MIRYNLSAELPYYRTPTGQHASLTLTGYIVIKEDYSNPRFPASAGGLEYPYVASNIEHWELAWASPVPLADFGNQTSFPTVGSGGMIEFHNDPNDASRPGDGFLPAYKLELLGSNNNFHVNDLEVIDDRGRYDMGIKGAFPDYELTDRFIFDVTAGDFLGGPDPVSCEVAFSKELEPIAPRPLAPTLR